MSKKGRKKNKPEAKVVALAEVIMKEKVDTIEVDKITPMVAREMEDSELLKALMAIVAEEITEAKIEMEEAAIKEMIIEEIIILEVVTEIKEEDD
jgi:hypothetical protein